MLIPSFLIVRAMMVAEGKLSQKELFPRIEVKDPGPVVKEKLDKRVYLGRALTGQRCGV